jgi:hypothetical protein
MPSVSRPGDGGDRRGIAGGGALRVLVVAESGLLVRTAGVLILRPTMTTQDFYPPHGKRCSRCGEVKPADTAHFGPPP